MAESQGLEGTSEELPEDIIQRILFFLTAKDAAKTSVLSKSWLRAWRTNPTLELSDRPFSPGSTKFFEYAKRTLERYSQQKVGIITLKVKLDCDCRSESDHYVDSLVKEAIQVAKKNGPIRNLDLFIYDYPLPEIVVQVNSLWALEITYCRLRQQVIEKIRCHHLKRLCLSTVRGLDEAMFQNIMSSCKLIEDLELNSCLDLENVIVTKLQYLKQFTFTSRYRTLRVEVEAPRIEVLTCWNLLELESMVTVGISRPCRFNLHTSQNQNLKSLWLFGVTLSETLFFNFEYKFPNLEVLSVEECPKLERMKVSSHSIKKIQLKYNSGLKAAQFDVTSIIRFEYESDNAEILPQLSFTAASCHWISHIDMNCWRNLDTSWFLKLKEFLINLIPSEISLYASFQGSVTFNIDETRNSAIFPESQQIQELSIVSCSSSSSDLSNILDGIFWICRPNTMKQYWINLLDKNEFMKFLFDNLMVRNNQNYHHNLQHIKFWQHELKDVRVELVIEGRRVEQAEFLDWEAVLSVLKTQARQRYIYFNLDWEMFGMLKQAK